MEFKILDGMGRELKPGESGKIRIVFDRCSDRVPHFFSGTDEDGKDFCELWVDKVLWGKFHSYEIAREFWERCQHDCGE